MLHAFSLHHVTYYRLLSERPSPLEAGASAIERRDAALRVPPTGPSRLNRWGETHICVGSDPTTRMRITRHSEVQQAPWAPEFFNHRSQTDWLRGARGTNFSARIWPVGTAAALGMVMGAALGTAAFVGIAGATLLSPLSLPLWLSIGAVVGGLFCGALQYTMLARAHGLFVALLTICEVYAEEKNRVQAGSTPSERTTLAALLRPHLKSEEWLVQQAALDCAALLDLPVAGPQKLARPPTTRLSAATQLSPTDICDALEPQR